MKVVQGVYWILKDFLLSFIELEALGSLGFGLQAAMLGKTCLLDLGLV